MSSRLEAPAASRGSGGDSPVENHATRQTAGSRSTGRSQGPESQMCLAKRHGTPPELCPSLNGGH